jgi:hypothetical protein
MVESLTLMPKLAVEKGQPFSQSLWMPTDVRPKKAKPGFHSLRVSFAAGNIECFYDTRQIVPVA